MPTETAKLTEGRINSMGAVEVATSSVKTEEPTESGAEEGNSVTKPQKGVPEGWLRSVVEQQEEILKNNPIVKEEKIHDPVDSESKHILEQNVHKREVIDYVKQRLKQLPIEKDEQAALNQMFRKVIGDPPPLSSKKKSMKFDKPAEQDCKSSNDLLEVSKLEHADAMRRSFRLLSQLGLDEVRRLYGSHSINRVRAAIFQLRQLQANRRSTVLRLQALKRRQTAMGNAHVRHLPTGINATYTCYFCSCGFSSVTQLHAHLLTQAHLCVNTPLGSGSVMGHKQTAIQVLEGQANNSNATDLDMHPQTKKPDTELNRLLQNLKQIDQKKDGKKFFCIPVYRCIYCGSYLRKDSVCEHLCYQEMEQFIEKEIQYMNLSGSPFVCLLCHGTVYDTPTQLQLHLAASHGADRGVTHCALCEVEFRPPTVNTGDIIRTMAGVYQRHLMTEHLPSLELTEKLLYMGSFLVPRNAIMGAPSDDSTFRSFRCVFHQGRPAGSGAPFPFPHWCEEGHRNWLPLNSHTSAARRTPLRNFPGTTVQTGTGIPQEGKRPSKLRADRTCLISPQIIFQHLSTLFPKLLSMESKLLHCSTGRLGDLGSLPQLTAHIICEHSGNPFTLPGARELVRAQHAAMKADQKSGHAQNVIRLTEEWLKAVKFADNVDKLETFRERMRSRSLSLSKRSIRASSSSSGSKYSSSNFNRSNIGKSTTKNRRAEVTNLTTKQLNDSLKANKKKKKDQSGFQHKSTKIGYESFILSKFERGKRIESFNRDYLFSYRASRYPIPAWLERNVADVPEEIRKKLRMATHAQHLSCRACKSGLMPSVRALITHIRDEHAKTLEARMIQMRRSGTFSGLIDPTRTCFQCYTILEDHFAFQIHTIVFHGARYPLVCGLCKHPLVNLCMTEEIQSFCAQLFDECGIKMDEEKWKRVLHMKPASQQCASTKSSGRGLLTTTEEPDLLGNRLLLDDEARALLEEEELATIVSCVKASMSVLRYSAQLVLRAMQMHEHNHVSTLRRRYLPTSIVLNRDKEQTVMAMHHRAQLQGVNQTMTEQYKDLQLRSGEEHERQLQVAPIKFGSDAWEKPKIGSTFKMLSPSEVKEEPLKPDNSCLPRELRRKFENIAAKYSTDD